MKEKKYHHTISLYEMTLHGFYGRYRFLIPIAPHLEYKKLRASEALFYKIKKKGLKP